MNLTQSGGAMLQYRTQAVSLYVCVNVLGKLELLNLHRHILYFHESFSTPAVKVPPVYHCV